MSVPIGATQATFAATLVDEWIRAGVGHAVVCPGSRSTPLALALAQRDEIELHVRLDERGACFFAVGLALASGKPAVVCTTSGTAAAELHAGVLEASHAGVPLLVCTADRPPRLHHVGAPQTIEQAGLFGPAVRGSFEPGVATDADAGWWRWFAERTVRCAIDDAGPVHLNLAFEEPLLGSAGPLPPRRSDRALARRPGAAAPDLTAARWRGPGLIVAGAGAPSPEVVLAAADRLGWPVLADPRSALRVEHPAVVSAADAFLKDPEVRAALRPQTVLLLGRPWASRVVAEFVAACGAAGTEVIALGETPADPARVVGSFHRADPAPFLAALAGGSVGTSREWRDRWEGAETAAQAAIDKTLESDPLSAGGRVTEPGVARHLFASLDAASILFVSSSMPVRDLEWYGAPRPRPPRVFSNRGVNGIDGVTSSALGVAAGQQGPVVAVTGDLAFLHDTPALAEVGRAEGGSCTLVVPDNRGGGIFSFLPQAAELPTDRFERLFGTPPTVSVAAVARGFGLPVAEVGTLAELDEALARFVGTERCALVRVDVPGRDDNHALHQRLSAAVAEAVRATLPG